MKLSLIIPSYNESKTLSQIVELVLSQKWQANLELEVIIVNDASKDSTLEIANNLAVQDSRIKVLSNEKNLGKTQTVKKGILASMGELVVIQDADLEYFPSDIVSMIDLMQKDTLDVVYGNRFGKHNKVIYPQNYVGNLALTAYSNLFTYFRIYKWIPDMEVCYKLVRGEIIRDIASTIQSISNFGFEPEVTAKLSKYKINGSHLKFGFYPISYNPRTVEEGKKIKVSDGVKALVEIFKFNLFD